MLYDPKKWDAKVKADPFNLESLVAWLEKQPRKGRYTYSSCEGCLLAQYFTAMGFENVLVGTAGFDYGPKQELRVYFRFALNDIAVDGPHTFGGALKRARAAMTNGVANYEFFCQQRPLPKHDFGGLMVRPSAQSKVLGEKIWGWIPMLAHRVTALIAGQIKER